MADATVLRKIYQVSTRISFAGLIVVILLVLHKSPAPTVATDPAAAKRVEQKFAAADQAKAAGQPAQVQMDGTELNSYLAQNLQLAGSTPPTQSSDAGPAMPAASISNTSASAAPGNNPANDAMAALSSSDPQSIEQVQSSVKDVKVDMDGDLVKAYVVFDFHGRDMSLELDGHMGTQDGYVKFQPVAGKLGSLPLPQATLDAAVEKMMASPENREKLKLPNDISDIKIEDGKAVLSYK
ncbi:MAG: hypothetical protein ABSF78_14935 [Candidatus Acidiferrales bacterium]|jgi:hypothetical protein